MFKKQKEKAMRKNLVDPVLDKSKLIEIVEVAEPNKDTTVIVPPTHTVLVVKNGSITEAHSSGEFFPVDKRESVMSLKLFFISKTARIRVRWGTQRQQRLNYIDPKIDMPVSVGAFGTMDVKIDNANKFFQELVPDGNTFTVEQLEEEIRNIAVDGLRRVLIAILREKHISYFDFEVERAYIQDRIADELREKFRTGYGFAVCDFYVDSLNIAPEEEEKIKAMQREDSEYNRQEDVEARTYALNRRRKENIVADLNIDKLIYESEKQRERDQIEYERKLRHEDEDRQWRREDKVFDAQNALEAARIESSRAIGVATANATAAAAANGGKPNGFGRHCPMCGSEYSPDAAYCPVCGSAVPKEGKSVRCPSCSAEAAWGTKYCPQCGQKLS